MPTKLSLVILWMMCSAMTFYCPVTHSAEAPASIVSTYEKMPVTALKKRKITLRENNFFAFFFQIDSQRHWFVTAMLYALLVIVILIIAYTIRHYFFSLNRLFARQRHPYLDIDVADWPTVTVLIPAHNEEAVIESILKALIDVDFPKDKLTIMPVNDRSTDATGDIIDVLAQSEPELIKPYHRKSGKSGKAAVLKEVCEFVESEVLLIFDADYIPGKGLIKQLSAPFFDPEVGAMMGRVIPLNVSENLLTRFLDFERSGGYQVDQQARMNLHLVPQYGGTVGGVRLSALKAVGGWDDETLAEDTDMTYRLLLDGWKTVYQNRSECYEEVPELWATRIHQLKRWAKGHNQCAFRYGLPLLFNNRSSFYEKLDGLMLLGVYIMSPLLLLGWLLAITLFFLGEHLMYGVIAILAVISYGTLGNFASFYEISTALRLDGRHQSIRLLAINIFNFMVSFITISLAIFPKAAPFSRHQTFHWHKTDRYRNGKKHAQ
ncbi:MAG: glycosyltransferase family 2 protein [Gammaproteobacteria bacterium]